MFKTVSGKPKSIRLVSNGFSERIKSKPIRYKNIACFTFHMVRSVIRNPGYYRHWIVMLKETGELCTLKKDRVEIERIAKKTGFGPLKKIIPQRQLKYVSASHPNLNPLIIV